MCDRSITPNVKFLGRLVRSLNHDSDHRDLGAREEEDNREVRRVNCSSKSPVIEPLVAEPVLNTKPLISR